MSQIPYQYKRPGEDPKIPPSLVFFEDKAIKNQRASTEAGMPIFDAVTFAKIVAPGQRNSEVVIEVYRKFPDGTERMRPEGQHLHGLFRQWQEKSGPQNAGTPLDQWPVIDIAQAEMFRFQHVYTVQQLAELPDGVLQHIGRGAREMRAKAQAWLAQASENVDVGKMASEIEELKELVRVQGEQLKQYAQSQNNIGFDRRQRGRPRKPEASLAEALSEEDDDASDYH